MGNNMNIHIEVEKKLFKQLENLLKSSGLANIEELIISILQNEVDRHSSQSQKTSQAEDTAIKDRLKNLGYL
jgi:metal-responsive CopG/Arc/MetJ family transcriptional regulator